MCLGMSVLEKLRAQVLSVAESHDAEARLKEMGFGADSARELARSKGIRSARALTKQKD